MRLTKLQRRVIVVWLIVLSLMLLVIPYTATYEDRQGKMYVDAGYSWVFQRPKYRACLLAVDRHMGRQVGHSGANCHIWPDFKRLALTLLAAVSGGAATLGLLGFIGGAPRPKRANSPSTPALPAVEKPKVEKPKVEKPRVEKPKPTGLVAELLAADPNLPISEGDITEARPLVINATNDYVGVEYRVVEMMQERERGIFFKFESQQIFERDGRKIDVLSYRHKVGSSAHWDGVKKYYFDVTRGYNASAR